MGPRHTRGHAEISEPLGTQRWWHFDSYSVRANAKFASAMYKHTPMPPFCYGTVYIRKARRFLQNSGTLFYVVNTQHLVAKPRIAS